MNNWKLNLFRFMQGRNGNDELGQFATIVGFVMVLVSNFIRLRILHTAGILLVAYACFRVVSKNVAKRQRENIKFMQFKDNLLGIIRNGRRQTGNAGGWQSRARAASKPQQATYNGQDADVEHYNYYRCRNCGQIVRVPKGKGTVKITCPECDNSFIDRT